ncbi:DHHW family protein [Ruminococcus flavefaciens]|uniref:DHHW protein n=1 Tax=Ruminococcus flavefaciens TaxID=1265 RepID=A0A1K1LNN9_RUMFL|nr:DHHW family protein [Ruminococcus flavefaciens]SFW12496.1 DHHW protein [Ruminococcus flavefaciens]
MTDNKNKNSLPEPSISIEASDRAGASIDVSIKPKKLKKQQRKKALNFISLANIVAISAIFAGGFVYVTLLPHETKADDENRYLTKFPEFSAKSYASGEFTEGVADYFDDTVHDRAHIKEFISDYIMQLKGRKYGADGEEAELFGSGFEKKAAVITTAPVTTAASVSTSVTTAVPEATTAPAEEAPADGELTNNILIVNKRGVTLYSGAWGAEQEYASYVSLYKEKLPDVNVYSMVLPTSSSFYLPEKYQNLAYSEKEDFDRLDAALHNVIPIDAYSILDAHKDEAIYSRTDHHWQPLGAYYAAQQFALTAGVPYPELSEYETVTLPGYVGTLYMYTQSATLMNNPEDFVYYKPKTPVTVTQYNTRFENPVAANLLLDPSYMANSGYYMVFGADERIVHVNTECKNGRTLVIFKDSYGNALLPMLTGSFENIYLCDIRYFDLNAVDFINRVGATDLLFAMCSFSAVGGNRNCIYNNLTK